MTSDIAILSPGIADYIGRHTSRPSELQQRLIDETQQLPWGRMQISATQAQFMAMFTRLLQPHCVVEIGTFTDGDGDQIYTTDGTLGVFSTIVLLEP